MGHDVTAIVDPILDGPAESTAHDDPSVIVADLDGALPSGVGNFDAIVAVDAIGRVRDTDAFLARLRAALLPGGRLLASVPNFAHWYPRSRVVTGRWSYDTRGLLDAAQLRFFTGPDAERILKNAGFELRRREVVGLPLEAERSRVLALADGVGVALRPTLFAYQYLFELSRPL